MRERTFTQADLIGGTDVPPGPGYLTYTRAAESGESPCGLQQQHPKRRGAEGGRQPALVAGRLPGGAVWWTPCPRQAVVRQALAASADGAVEVCPHGAGDGATGLGLALARHLARHRARHGGGAVGPCSLTPPEPLPQTVRLPHLVRVCGCGRASDRVVWETLAVTDADAWLGRPLHRTDLDYFARHLPALLVLKHRSRTPCGLQKTPQQWELSRLLAHQGRYVSIRLVLQHPDLFRVLTAQIIKESADELLDRPGR